MVWECDFGLKKFSKTEFFRPKKWTRTVLLKVTYHFSESNHTEVNKMLRTRLRYYGWHPFQYLHFCRENKHLVRSVKYLPHIGIGTVYFRFKYHITINA